MASLFEWNIDKAESNKSKHGVSFLESTEVFKDKNKITTKSDQNGEERFKTTGDTKKKGILDVIWCKRPPKKRIISAHKASKKTKRKYLGQ